MTRSKMESHRTASISLCFLLLSIQAVQLHADSLNAPPDALKLWYTRPATEWTEALPIGNGRLGAMVYGGIEREHLQLNEDTLWSGGPHCYDNPDAYGHLATVRELLERGEYAEAEATAENMLGIPKYQQAYMPLGDLFLDFPKGEEPSELPPRAQSAKCSKHGHLPYRRRTLHAASLRIPSRPGHRHTS